MKEKDGKIEFDPHEGLEFSYLQSKNWMFFYQKINYLKKELEKLQGQKTKEDPQTYQRVVFSIEIISSVIHFTEVFTARILGMKNENLYDYLVNYRPYKIKEFYEKIETLSDEDIAQLIQLPYPFDRFKLEEDQLACKKAVRITRKNLAMISKFFLKHYLLYNAYKHGFRINILNDKDNSENFLILFYDEIGKMSEENLIRIEENIEDIWDHFMFMSKSLNGIEDNYKNRVFLKKDDLTIIASELDEENI